MNATAIAAQAAGWWARKCEAERALADDLYADLAKARARLGRGIETESMARYREARK